MAEREDDNHRRLAALVEQWYVWMSSRPAVIFGESDMRRMMEPIVRLRGTSEWLSQSAVAKADWFIETGARLIVDRLVKGDYDLYE